jgi:protocatechuate 3,4-dioxygenase beta subunit/glutamine cyclotransferase
MRHGFFVRARGGVRRISRSFEASTTSETNIDPFFSTLKGHPKMKSNRSNTPKVRNGKPSVRHSAKVRQRAAEFKLESLEPRTLLSVSSSTHPTKVPVNAKGHLISPATNGSPMPTAISKAVKDAHTVATVAAPTGPTSVASTGISHIYTGKPANFGTPSTPPSPSGSTTNPGQYSPAQIAALKALSKDFKAIPQYVVMPSTGSNPLHLDFEGPAGYAPAQISGAYGIGNVTFSNGVKGTGAGQTIAVTDVGDYPGFVNTGDPNFAASALHIFDQQFGLPDPPNFTKYNMLGQTTNLPAQNEGWFLEIALDVEWSHAMAPDANIDLVEASVSSLNDLAHASNTAATMLGASVVSQSWGLLEVELGTSYTQFLENTWYVPAVASNPNVTFLAASGDGSAVNGPIFPSSSPLNVSVGGTSLFVTGTTRTGESVWSGGGGGPSEVFPIPSYQQGVIASNYPSPGENNPLIVRTSPDVSAVANPGTGVSVYEPELYGGWVQVGGTSVATPITAATIAIANQGRTSLGGQPLNGTQQTLPGLYAAYESGNAYTPGTGYFNDIVSGSNGYEAGPGYDLGSGIGSEQANNLLPFLSLFDLGPAVVASDPAQGQVVTTTPPTNFSLTFNEPIVPGSVVAGDFTVNGTPADSATLSPDDTTIYYSFTSSPVITQGIETMNLPAGSVEGANDLQFNHAAFNSSFFFVYQQLAVVATSPPVGSVLKIPGDVDLVVQFNEAFDPYAINAGDFEVSQGYVSNAKVLTPEAVDLTISGMTQDGTMTLTLPAGALKDSFGVPNLAFSGTYITDIVSQAYPTPLGGKAPAGSLIYDPSVNGTIGFVGDTDTYTLPLAAGQQLSAVMSVDPGLIGTITVLDPGGNTVATATGSGAGATVVLESAPVNLAGTYSIVVGGSGGTTGAYNLQAILNAAYKQSSDNIGSIPQAYSLDNAFISLGTTPYADRAGVLGNFGTESDYYGFHLDAGESTTIAFKGTGDSNADIILEDASGNTLALPSTGKGVDAVISDFIASVSGEYYVATFGAPFTQYSLVVTRGADFTLHGNSFANAQPLNGGSVVLGAILKSTPSLYLLDDVLYNSYNPIYPTDPTTGQFSGPSFPQPGSPLNNPFGLNLAYDGTDVYFNDGPDFGNNQVYQVDPSTGTVLNSFLPQEPYYLFGIAYFKGDIWATDSVNIYDLDATTGAVKQEFANVVSNATGITADPDNGMLYAVSQNNLLYEINPATGEVVNTAPDNAQGLNEQDMAYANGMLIVSDTNGLASSGGTNVLDEYDPNTLAFIQRVAVPVQGFASGLGGDGLGGPQTDWYSFNVNAGDSLVLTTTTPGATTASGLQFPNDLNPTINLYDAAGNLVATATGNASDGRNDVINWTALTSGSYRVQILGATKASLGEYTIAIQGATGGANAFTVTSTNPAAGSDLGYQVSSMDVTFSSSVLVSSVNTSDFTIDGSNATGAFMLNNNTVEFTFPTTSNGTHNVSISGIQDLQGTTVAPDNFSFQTDDVPPVVVSSSIADGANLPPGPLTEVITFSKAIQPSSANPSDVLLYGFVRGIEYPPSSISFDSTDTVMTVTYNNVPKDAYEFILEAGPNNFVTPANVPLQNSFFVNFTVSGGTTNITGLKPVLPLGSLVYNTSIDGLLLSSTDSDTYDLAIDPHQTLGVVVTPESAGMSVTVQLYSPSGHLIGTATSPSPGLPAVLPAVQSSAGGTYQFVITGGPGQYKIEPVLNALLDPASYGGLPNGSIATATSLDPYANKFAGNNEREAVLGSITGASASFGDALVAEFNDVILIDKATGNVLQHFTSPDFNGLILFDVALAADNTFYVLGDVNDFTGVIVHMNLQGQTLGAFTMPVSDNPGFLSPEGFGLDPKDGSFWVPLANSATLVHVTNSGGFIAEYSVPSNPDDAAVGPDGAIYISQVFSGYVSRLDPSTGIDSYFASSSFPLGVTWSTDGFMWVGDLDNGAEKFSSSGGFPIAYYGGYPTSAGESYPATGNVWDTNLFGTVYQFAANGSILTTTGYSPEQPGLAVLGDVPNEQPLPQPNSPVYSFTLDQGESATIAVESLNGKKIAFTLLDDNGNELGVSSPGATNYTAGLNNFVAPADGTYYIATSGDIGVQFNLVVTRGADFSTQPHSTLATAQDITATQGSGDNKLGGALGYLSNPSGAVVGSTFEGIDFNGSNCGCRPPDTNAAVGGNYVFETVNFEARVFDKTTGAILLDEPLATLFGQTSFGDVYVNYDTIASRWYVEAFNGSVTDILLVVSKDANPLDGFLPTYDLNNLGGAPDYPKMGFNKDAIFISYNDFSQGGAPARIITINKADALAGTLVDFVTSPKAQFQAMPPAQLTQDTTGGTEWFISTDGTNAGGDTMRVTEMTNYFSSNPTFTYTSLPVAPYQYATSANQPGGTWTTGPNTTTTQVLQAANGELVTAMASSTAADGFEFPKGLYYVVNISGGTPALATQGVVDPGQGVAVQMFTAAMDSRGDLGFTWMEGSSTQYVSMWVGGIDTQGNFSSTNVTPDAGFFFVNDRIGDYSSVVVDPTDGNTFWAANEYSGPDAGSNIWRTKIASFQVYTAIGTDYYSVNANAGDNLHFATTTPAGGPDEFVNNFYPELLLYDPNGNLVAIANGNASDGRNSVIDFTVPDGDAGKWTIEVTPSPSTQTPTAGEYGLLVTGATGALSPFVVTATTPAANAVVQPPTDIIVTVNDPILATSLTPGELTVNGVAATAVTMVDAHTIDWSVPSSAFGTGIDLPNVVTIGADALGNQVTDVSGQTLTPYSYTFYTTNVAPYIVSSSIDGQVFSPAPADVSEVVTFSQPMNPAATTQSSFSLYGNFMGVTYAAASWSWDPTDTVLTINYTGLPNDTYTLTLFAGGFQNQVGIPLASNYVANFSVALGTAAFDGKLAPVKPLGDLIYTGTDDPVLVTPTDVDNLTLALNAGETLTLIASPTTSDLQLVMSVLDPSNNVIATTTASAAGLNAVLETVTIGVTGTYTIQISDANGNIGQYSVTAYLNSFVKQGTANDTIPTAQDLTGTSYSLDSAGSDRLAAVGSLPANVLSNGDAYVSSRYWGFYFGGSTSAIVRVNAQGQVVQTIEVPQDQEFSLSGVELDPVNNMLYAAVTTSFNSGSVSGELLEFNPLTGQLVATITLPNDPADNFYYYPYGFSIGSDGSFWVPQPNSGNIIHLDASGNELASYSTDGLMPESASIGADGNVYFSSTIGNLYQLNPSTGSVNYFGFTESPFGTLTSTAPGGAGTWAADYYQGGLLYNYAGGLDRQVGFYGANQVQSDASGNAWIANSAYWDLFKFDPGGSEIYGTFVPFPIGETVWGTDNPNPPAQDTQDYYSFSLTQGESATAVVESLNGKNAQISIVDGNGNVLATGVAGATNVSESISKFIAPYTGTFYIEITGDPGLQYSTVVTRQATFTLQDHHTSSTAQDLTGTTGVLGYLAPPTSPLYLLDDQLYGAFNPIYPTDPTTGAFTGPAFPQPGSPLNNPFGLNLAYDGTDVYFNNGPDFGDNRIYKVDPNTGTVLNSFLPQEPYYLFDIAWLNGNLWATDSVDIYELDPNTGAVLKQYNNVVNNATGLTGDADNGMLYAVSQGFGLYEIDPNTGAVVKTAPDNSQGLNEQDMAYAGGLLIVSDTNGLASQGGTNVLDEYDPNTLAFVARVPVAVQGFASGLGGDGLGGGVKPDWYSVNVQQGQELYLTTSTPSDQGGQFPNTGSFELSLYDTFGNLVATGTKSPDGRNETLFYNAPISGQYHIEITEDPGGQGEYFLSMTTAAYPSGGVSGEVYNDLNGNGNLDAGEPGLQNWEVDVFDSNNNFVASQLTDANGDFNFQGLEPGTYTVDEILQSGWTQTAPPAPGTFTVTITAGNTITGQDFGNVQNITISGEKFNDLNGDGTQEPGEPGLQGWTIDLFDAAGDLVATTVTDANGDFSFTDVFPGTYTVQEEQQPGWIQTAPAPPGTYTFNATSGQDVSGLIFGNYQLVTYTGQVYNDLNGDGSNDGGTDPGLQGWTVNLLDQNGNLVATTTSDANGDYSFANLGPGTYTIEEVNQNGWYQTQPQNPFVYTLTATSGSSTSGLDFGNFQLVNVTGEVYNDLNGNGNLDPGEPGLQGWTVLLLNAAGNTVASTTSDANGNYEFDNLFPGTFIVEEVLMAGWIQTQPVNPNYYEFTTQSGLDQTGLNFGNFLNSENLSGQVYNDLNGDGSNDGGTDPGLGGWTINVLNSSGVVVATTTSDASGDYSFSALPVAAYTIEEITQTGWVLTQPLPNPPGTYSLPPLSGSYTDLNFGNFQTVTVSGNVYNDLNGNGQQNPGEPGLKGWTVDVYNAAGAVVGTATTDANGNYTITGIGPGSFTLGEIVQSGWYQTQPTNPNYYSFTTSSGSNISGGIFGNFHTITVTGNVYNDLDGNGLRNGAEPGLAGWTVNLETSSGTIIATVMSDANGNYAFTGVGGGTFDVAEVQQTGWVQTQPLYPTVYTFTTRSGGNLTALNFGNHAAPALSPVQVIDNGQAGYAETGTWSTVVGGFNGTNRVARTTHGSGSTATASWTFTGLAAQTYFVYITYAGKATYSTAAPFTVYDGGANLGTQSIDEHILVTQSQGGRAQGSYGGVGWLELGTYAISSGTLEVLLSNKAAGNYVDADGVLIVPDGALPKVVVGNPPPPSGGTTGGVSIGANPTGNTGDRQTNSAPSVSISGVTQPGSVNVVYSAPPAQGNSTTSSASAVDLVLGDLADSGVAKKKGQF